MRFSHSWLLALCATAASAFRDASPFFLHSSSTVFPPLGASGKAAGLISSSSLLEHLRSSLSSCPSDVYVLVSQAGVNAVDYESRKAAPRLRQAMDDATKSKGKKSSSFQVPDVVGDFDVGQLQNFLTSKCEARVMSVDASTGSFPRIDDMKPRVVRLDFPAPTGSKEERTSKLSENGKTSFRCPTHAPFRANKPTDAFLSSITDLISPLKYTIVYTTTPSSGSAEWSEPSIYGSGEASGGSYHVELKRDAPAAHGNSTLINGPLFERYQFFTPGLFMGLLVSFVLLSILTVAVRGVASLQVPYAAFDKEMGPGAKKKQ